MDAVDGLGDVLRGHLLDAVLRRVLVVALLLGARAEATIAFVSASATACSQTSSTLATLTCTLSASTTANNTVLVGIVWRVQANTVSTVTDSGGSTYTAIAGTLTNSAGATGTEQFFSTTINAAHASTTVTVTMSGNGKFVFEVVEYSGVQSFGNTNTAAPASSPGTVSVTNHDNRNVCVGMFGTSGNNTWSGTSGCTGTCTQRLQNAQGSSTGVNGALVDSVLNAAGTCTVGEASTGATIWAIGEVELRSFGSISFVQIATAASVAASPCTTGSITASTGNTIVVAWAGNGGNTDSVTSITQSSGSNTYVQKAAISNGATNRVEVWVATNITGFTGTISVNYIVGTDAALCGASEYAGAAGGVGATTTGTSGVANPSLTITTTGNNSWCVMGSRNSIAFSGTAGAGHVRWNVSNAVGLESGDNGPIAALGSSCTVTLNTTSGNSASGMVELLVGGVIYNLMMTGVGN